MSTALDRLRDALTAHDCYPNDHGEAKCPAHDDGGASLSFAEGDNGAVLLKCEADCTPAAIIKKLGLYTNEAGELFFVPPDAEPQDVASDFEKAVVREIFTVRVRAAARSRLAAESDLQRPFDVALLSEIVDEPIQWRVDGLFAMLGRLLLVAQRKTGKTTAALNLILRLILGGLFLGRFRVTPIVGRAAFLNFEVSRPQFARWGREVGIPGDRLLTVHLRGCPNPFATSEGTAALAALMREHAVEAIVVDPFGRAYSGKSQNDPGEVAAWLSDLDRFATAAGCSELVLTTHAGWDGERTRGASALEDWADTVATIVRDKEDEHLRYFRASGRDVEVEEDRLNFDPTTRRLTLAGSGSRSTARVQRRTDELVNGIVEAVTAEPGATVARLEARLREAGLGIQRGDVGRAARAAAEAGKIVRVPGKQRRQHHYLKGQEGECSRVLPSGPGGSTGALLGVLPTPPCRRRSTTGLVGASPIPGMVDTSRQSTPEERQESQPAIAGTPHKEARAESVLAPAIPSVSRDRRPRAPAVRQAAGTEVDPDACAACHHPKTVHGSTGRKGCMAINCCCPSLVLNLHPSTADPAAGQVDSGVGQWAKEQTIRTRETGE